MLGKNAVHPIPLTFRPMVPSRLHRFQQSAVPKGHGLDVEPGLKLRTTPYFNMYQLLPCLSILQKCCLQVLQNNITPNSWLHFAQHSKSQRTPRTPECADARLSPKLESADAKWLRFCKRNPTKRCFSTDSQQENSGWWRWWCFSEKERIQMDTNGASWIFRLSELFSSSRLLTHECHLVADGRQIAIQIMHLTRNCLWPGGSWK